MDLYSTTEHSNIQWRFSTEIDNESEDILKNVDKSDVLPTQPGCSNGETVKFSQNPVHYEHLSSDEEADVLSNFNDLTRQLLDLKIIEKDKFTLKYTIEGEGEQVLHKWMENVEGTIDNLRGSLGDGMEVESEVDEDNIEDAERANYPSGITTAGVIKNADLDPRDLVREVDFGKMETVHQLNITDGIDECCEIELPDAKKKLRVPKRSSTLGRITQEASKHMRLKAMTLPYNMPKWSRKKNASDAIRSSAATVFRKGRSLFKNTTNFFRPILRGQGDTRRSRKRKEEKDIS